MRRTRAGRRELLLGAVKGGAHTWKAAQEAVGAGGLKVVYSAAARLSNALGC